MLKPLYDKVIIKRFEVEELTESGLYVSSIGSPPYIEGEVLAVGEGRLLTDGSIKPLQVRVGDRVMLGKFSGQLINTNNEDLYLVREDEIFGVLMEEVCQ